jgi:hypothetical protein
MACARVRWFICFLLCGVPFAYVPFLVAEYLTVFVTVHGRCDEADFGGFEEAKMRKKI